jgi:hypothetical protein
MYLKTFLVVLSIITVCVGSVWEGEVTCQQQDSSIVTAQVEMKPARPRFKRAPAQPKQIKIFDFQITNIYRSTRGFLIFFSTGTEDHVLDKPLSFDVHINTGDCRDAGGVYHPIDIIETRMTLSPGFDSLYVPLDWPYHIRYYMVRSTVNPDRSFPESDYTNNNKIEFITEKEGKYFKLIPFPEDNPNHTCIFRIAGFVYCNGDTLTLRESVVKEQIERGNWIYFPDEPAHMLKIPVQFRIANHGNQDGSATLYREFITYDGKRTVSSNITRAKGECQIITANFMLKVQSNNFMRVWIRNGSSYAHVNVRFVGLPWKFD